MIERDKSVLFVLDLLLWSEQLFDIRRTVEGPGGRWHDSPQTLTRILCATFLQISCTSARDPQDHAPMVLLGAAGAVLAFAVTFWLTRFVTALRLPDFVNDL